MTKLYDHSARRIEQAARSLDYLDEVAIKHHPDATLGDFFETDLLSVPRLDEHGRPIRRSHHDEDEGDEEP